MTDLEKKIYAFLSDVEELTDAEVSKYAGKLLKSAFIMNDQDNFQLRLAKTAMAFMTRYETLQKCHEDEVSASVDGWL